MAHFALLILIAPLIGFLFNAVNGSQMKEKAIGGVATAAIVVSFISTVVCFFQLLGDSNREVTVNFFTWIHAGTLTVPAAVLVDPLAAAVNLHAGLAILLPGQRQGGLGLQEGVLDPLGGEAVAGHIV